MNGGPSGFNNAPVTRGFVVASALFTILFGIRARPNTTALSYKDIFVKLKLWKFVASIFAFSSTPELIFGLCLLYYFRVFERQIGSNKYSVFVLFSVLVSLGLQILVLAFVKDPSINILSSGPYGLIFSSFVPFFFDIPISTRFHVLGVHFSDKSFIYLAGLQLFFSSWKRSMLSGLCGILAGSLYHVNFLRIRKIKFPQSIASFCSRISLPSLGMSPAAPSRNSPPAAPTVIRRPVDGNYPSSVASLLEPPEDSISTLVSMGFDRNHARQALVQARNDINAATNILLEAQLH